MNQLVQFICDPQVILQVAIEVPYLFSQAIVFVIITYSMIGYYGTAYKLFWYFYAMFSTLLYFNFLGMLLVSLTPDVAIAGALTSVCYPMLNLFSGFLIPQLVSYIILIHNFEIPFINHNDMTKT